MNNLDIACRLGEDEFAVLKDRFDTDEQQKRDKALKIAEKLIQLANAPLDFNGITLQVDASAGITIFGLDHLDADAAIRKSDVAMNRSKKAGKGRAGFSE